MTYSVKEMFYSLQGEGHHSGRPSVFCRFAGCNLWNGKEASRATSVCTFCDTDFIGTDGQNGGKFKTEAALAEAIESLWPENAGNRFVVFTGGEPALQLTPALIRELQQRGFECAVESNGTLPLPTELDWVCISPKGSSEVVITECDELKLVYPQQNALPERFAAVKARYRYLSPLNDWTQSSLLASSHGNTQQCIEYCLQNPQWRLTLQSHKILNID
ncbi:7-carboxy-7-deazaguanine synthase [Reinekea marinisedimentorum]|uniref:7-carboxy-7-deazaguanine synthase n=1 Tax=Reinekea marinisedimentorum TaxID=230495 RepID=A0A4R3I9J6_9GAMM|nr:7-carboxy-7-deazaguanine synthase [Reinekea marinisedimentorum]TCS42062.1 7-carboxy-7-deazaguanine synthase (Cx14CxxC type) [Reinekea marinisedimentorum]